MTSEVGVMGWVVGEGAGLVRGRSWVGEGGAEGGGGRANAYTTLQK